MRGSQNKRSWPIGEAAGAGICGRRLKQAGIGATFTPVTRFRVFALRHASDTAEDVAECAPEYVARLAGRKVNRIDGAEIKSDGVERKIDGFALRIYGTV